MTAPDQRTTLNMKQNPNTTNADSTGRADSACRSQSGESLHPPPLRTASR